MTVHAAAATDPVPPAALQSVAARIDQHLATFLRTESDHWRTFDARLGEPLDALATLVLGGGKRLRPAFCVWGAVAAGADPGLPSLDQAGVALELLHAFALLHDDVMDNADTRRGRPTVHRTFAAQHTASALNGEARRYSEGVAILLGDLAHVLADRALGSVPDSARKVWDKLRTEVDVGQLLDLLSTAEGDREEATARRIARAKSGGYTIERPLHLGAALAGCDERTSDALSAYGRPLGEAFQLRDDLLGVFGDPARTGKPVGDDLREGKTTVLLAAALARAHGAQLQLLDRIGATDLSDVEVDGLQQVLIDTGARAALEADLRRLCDEAATSLASPAISVAAREPLLALAEFVVARDA